MMRQTLLGFAIFGLFMTGLACTATSHSSPTTVDARRTSSSTCPDLSAFTNDSPACVGEDHSMTPTEHMVAWNVAGGNASRAWSRDPADRSAALAFASALIHAIEANNPNAACHALFAVANYSYGPCAIQSHHARNLMACYLGRLIMSCRGDTESGIGDESREQLIGRAIHSLIIRPCQPGEQGYQP